MSYLRCNARNCSNNQNDLCIREGIRVDGMSANHKDDTCCSSFTQRGESYSNVVTHDTTAKPETDIQCDAGNCNYNKECRCFAPSVDISGSSASTSRETQCSNFDCKHNCR